MGARSPARLSRGDHCVVEGRDAVLLTVADQDDAREGLGLARERAVGAFSVPPTWARTTRLSSSRSWSTVYRTVLPA